MRSADARWPIVAAAAIVVAVVAADVAAGERAVLVGLLICAPLLCGLTTSPATTRAFALVAVACALPSFAWNDTLGTWGYWVPLTVVTLASSFAVLTAVYRERQQRDAMRLGVLAAIGEVAHGERDVRETAQAIADVLVPDAADLCLVDRVGGEGEIQRLAGAFSGDAAVLQRFLARPPSRGTGGAASTVAPQRTIHLARIDDAVRRRLAHDDEDLRLLREMAVDSAVMVPLIARGTTIGVLTLGTRGSRPPFDAGAVKTVETIAGRAALAVDNAALSRELSSTEQQLEAILRTVDGAIMARDLHGRLVYANQAAAELLRLPDVDAVAAASSAELMDRFEVFDVDGGTVDLASLPGTRVFRGELNPPPVTVRNVVRSTGEERWLLNKATAVVGDDGHPVLSVNLIEDVSELKRSEITERLLAAAARQATGAADVAAILQAVTDAAVPGLADWAAIDLPDDAGGIQPVAISHRDPEMVRLGWWLRSTWPSDPHAETGVAQVLRTGEAQLIRDIPDELLETAAQSAEHLDALRRIGLNSTLTVAVRAGDEVLGAMSFVSSSARRFDERDLSLAEDLGRQVGVSVKNAQLNHERAHIAHTLQAGLLPDTLPDVEGWRVSSVYRPAGQLNEVGGDFYDVVAFEGGWAMLIGDVVGKGAEAAAITALVRHTLASVVESSGDAGHALGVLDRRLRARPDTLPALCTVAIVTVSADEDVTIWSAGHPLPLLRRGGTVKQVGRTSPMLGVQAGLPVLPATVPVLPGDQLLLYTDGVIDATGTEGRFGEERLHETLAGLRPGETTDVARRLLASIDAFATGEQADDIAILVLERRSAGAQRHAAA